MSTADAVTARRREHFSFFRQSGWMLVANAVAGACFMLVHTPASRMATVSKAEYATFGALLDSLLILGIPAGGLHGGAEPSGRSALRRGGSWPTLPAPPLQAGVRGERTSCSPTPFSRD